MNALSIDNLLLGNWGTELVTGFDPGQRFMIVMALVVCATGIILGLAGIISGTINSMHRRRLEWDMKRDLVERGMSADEIAKIIDCATPPEDATQRWIASWACKNKKTG